MAAAAAAAAAVAAAVAYELISIGLCRQNIRRNLFHCVLINNKIWKRWHSNFHSAGV